jgi:hypothetical protein
MVRRETMPALLVGRLGSRRFERSATVVTGRRRLSPRATDRGQIGAGRSGRLSGRRDGGFAGRMSGGIARAVGRAPVPRLRSVGSTEGDGHRAEGYWPAAVVAAGTAVLCSATPERAPETQKSWRRPIFPKGCPLSIFGAGELDFRVRDGNGYGLSASVTRIRCVWMLFGWSRRRPGGRRDARASLARAGAVRFIDLRVLSRHGSITIPATDPRSVAEEVKPSTISTAQLHPSPNFHMRPIKQVVSLRSYPVDPVGNLISRRASHLDAFSAYPDRT